MITILEHERTIAPATYPSLAKNASRFGKTYDDNGNIVEYITIDSIASQASRMEDLIKDLVPNICFDPQVPGEPEIHICNLSHRIYDAYLANSVECGTGISFKETTIGKSVYNSTPEDCTHLYEYCPQVLVFGAWNTFGAKINRNSKFQRIITAEIIAYNPISIVDQGLKLDNLNLTKDSFGGKKSSELGFGCVPFERENRISVNNGSVRRSFQISHGAIRNIRFGTNDRERNEAGQNVIKLLAEHANNLFIEKLINGISLRSGCDLFLSKEKLENFSIQESEDLFMTARENAEKHGLSWESKTKHKFVPNKKLQEALNKNMIEDQGSI